MKFIVGKKYRVTDAQGTSLVMVARTEAVLEIAPSFLAGMLGIGSTRIHSGMFDADLTIEPLEGQAHE